MIINSPNQALPGITISREGPPRRHIDQDLSSVSSVSADFFANGSHIMAGASTVWLEF